VGAPPVLEGGNQDISIYAPVTLAVVTALIVGGTPAARIDIVVELAPYP
jgi:hypothetical protein